MATATIDLARALDPVAFARDVSGFASLDPWQQKLLQTDASRIALTKSCKIDLTKLCSRDIIFHYETRCT
jgi:hypothetical protein